MDAITLSRSITTAMEELARETDRVRISQTLRSYLEALGKFHTYSACNQFLICLQKPEATRVAGYRTWSEKFKRQVRRGEKGIAILAPCICPAKNVENDQENQELLPVEVKRSIYFKVTYVFDVLQTEGEPLPEAPEWRDREKDLEMEKALLVLAQERGITVETVASLNGAQGSSSGGRICLLPDAGTRVFVHELAHELFRHSQADVRAVTSKKQREIEADASAYVVCRYFGLSGTSEPNYLALWQAAGSDILDCLERVRVVITDIINSTEKFKEQKESATISQPR